MTYEQAQARYDAYKARRAALPPREKAFFDKLDAVTAKIGNHGASWGDMVKISKLHDNNAIDASIMFFNYGFLKGQRMAKAQMKRKEKTHK